MTPDYIIAEDQELPTIRFEWPDPATGDPYDFSTGWTWELHLVKDGETTASLSVSTGFTGDNEYPNVVYTPTSDVFASLGGTSSVDYKLKLIAVRQADSYRWEFARGNNPIIRVEKAITAAT